MVLHQPLRVALGDVKALPGNGQRRALSAEDTFHALCPLHPQKAKQFMGRPLKWATDCLVGRLHTFAADRLGFLLANCSASLGSCNQPTVGF